MVGLAGQIPAGLWSLGVAIFAVLIAIGLHRIIVWVAQRAAGRTRTELDDALLRQLRRPTLWLLITLTLSAAQPALDLSPAALRVWAQIAGLAVPALVGWLVIALVGVATDLVKSNADISTADNLQARRRRTRIDILNHIAVFVVLLATFCFMLMSIPSVRNIGVTLIASAGLAALAVGAAAQPALKNLIAGLQMAFTEPIRIDDVVVVNGVWGRIERIYLTFVVIKLWDERRLIVPVSKFLEEIFQNWTRETSAILGSVIWYFDPAADTGALREKLHEIVKSNPKWDGRFCNLQVTDTKPEAIEVRALMTAKDASTAFDLRCDVRENLLKFVRAEMPQALVRYRTVVDMDHPDVQPA